MAINVTNAVSAYSNAIDRLQETKGNSARDQIGQSDFSQMVKNFAESAVEIGKTSEQQSARAAAGTADLNQAVMAVSEAELTLNTVIAVRDKVLEAYRQIIRMPI
ncbi:MAG: flagellar hook-basal body complex protein FliE [Rhodospirillaceae bacterium]